jgi:hypothetical protein
MHRRFLHRDHRDRLDLGDRLEHPRLGHQILAHRLDVGYRNQHRLDEELRPGEVHHLDVARLTDLGEHRQHRLDEVHHLDVGRGPFLG